MPGGGNQRRRLSTPLGPPLTSITAYNDEIRVYI
nr:MAG TPA: hypothetical protein [Bacteriophage sp.]